MGKRFGGTRLLYFLIYILYYSETSYECWQKVPQNAPQLCEKFLNVMRDLNGAYQVDFIGVKTVTRKTTGNEELRYTVVLSAGVMKTAERWKSCRLHPMLIFKI